MKFFTRFHAQRCTHWPTVEQAFGSLTPQLFQQALQLKTYLAIHAGPSGRFRDILSRPQDHPLLYLHYALLADLMPKSRLVSDESAGHLLAATTLTFAATQLQQYIPRPDTLFDDSFTPLADALTQAAEAHLSILFTTQSPFWEYYHTYRQEQAAARQLTPALSDDWQTPAAQWAIAKIPVTATALLIERQDLLPQLQELTDHLNLIFVVLEQLATFRRNIYSGEATYVIDKVRQAAGIAPEETVEPQRLLGALFVTAAVDGIMADLQFHRQAGHQLAVEMLLPTLANYTTEVAQVLADVQKLISIQGAGLPLKIVSLPFFAPGGNLLSTALKTAEAYLLSDLTFRESWETQRGLSGTPELVGRLFPAGLVIEVLNQCGHALVAQVADSFEQAERSGFRYYQDFPTLPPDADVLGLLLRLHRYAAPADQPQLATLLQEPLNLMQQAMLPSGEIPVWLDSPPEGVQLWGHSCATTQINVLLGLLSFNPQQYRQVIEAAATAAFAQLMRAGLAANLYYGVPYVVRTGLTFVRQLQAQHKIQLPLPPLSTAQTFFESQLGLAAQAEHPSPQDAAFYTLACLENGLPVTDSWPATVLKHQLHDGSWPAEPLYLIPHRYGTTWYASKLVTTAICYQALKLLTGD